jgi:glycosyltransferase involved in cell wall biosynthesis
MNVAPLPPGISVVVPVYNSQESLPLLLPRLEEVLRRTGRDFEVVLVNDNSRDQSWDVILDWAARCNWVRGFTLMRNFGQHNTLLCGIREARFDTIVTLDDDLQNPPEEMPKLLAKLDEGFDVVYGTPERKQHGLLRNIASQITKIVLQHSMGAETARRVDAYRAIRTQTRDAFGHYRSPFVSIDVLLTWATTRFGSVTVRHDARELGRSNYTLRKLFLHTMNMMTGFSTMPLQVASWIGFAFTLVGLVVLAWVVAVFLIKGSTVAGFPFLASIIAIFSGAQLFALGIIGEYIARIHYRTMERPPYIVRTQTPTDRAETS